MKRTIISIVAVAIVVVGGYFALSNGNTGGSNSGDQNVASSIGAGKKISFSEFIKGDGSYKCSVSQNVDGTETKGAVFIDGDMMRGEYGTKVQGFSVDMSLIVRDGYSYTWTSLAPTTGFKVKAVSSISSDTQTDTAGNYSFNAEEIGEYDCETWTPDVAMFALPADVSFSEI